MTRMFVSLAGLLLVATPLFAAPIRGTDYAPPAQAAPPDITGLILRLVGMTAFLLALCGLVMYLARRANQPGSTTADPTGRMKHEGTLALDRVCAVHLIAVEGQTVAVTTDATGLRSMVLLSEEFEMEPETTGESEETVPPVPQTQSADDIRQLLQGIVRSGNRAGVHLEPALRHNQA